ncbi:hypothetical protein PR202_gb03800 [Eleusine coracana subsp. coracana]|uniref:BRCT domain-containing protein n=1 Tax=Eleusine coracana subsp. coracana TaxID=191504 RepID=A0AAV5E193_ELECO|nr:hypothetical protein PR202_gb03800 [Eleusine coracana subsp. coracana]
MSLVAYDASSDEEDAGEPPAPAAPSPPPFASAIGPQPRPPSPSTSMAAAPQSTPPPPAPSQNVVPASSSNVSLPTPSLDLPDVADLFAPLQSLPSSATNSSSRDNASRKRESNGSVFQDSKSKFPRTQSQPRGARNVAGNSLVPPQLRGRDVPSIYAVLTLSEMFQPFQADKNIRSHHNMGTMSTARILGRLDYLNSQEPGDESQATAIGVVERLLVEDDMDSFQKVSTDQISKTKPASILGTKVAQCLAKRAECSSPFQKSGSFNWVDAPDTDECSASVISRKKQRIHAKTPVKYLHAQSYGNHGSGNRADFVPECTDDDLGGNSYKMQEPVGSSDDLCEAYDIGPCTQMAAEAMEALSNASNVNCCVTDNEHLDSSILRRSSGKERKADKMPLVESPVDNRIGGSSIKHPSKSRDRKNPKLISGKAKTNIDNGIMQETVNPEVSKGIMRSGADKSNILGSDVVIHPKRKTTYMFISGNSKVQFNKASRSTTISTKSTEVTESSTAKTVGISDPDFNQLTGLKEQPKSLQKNHNSSLTGKILTYFGLPVATSISDATHFVAEKFARTRNMLEAIAMGIPVVTPSWLECCGEARCFIDEKKYIMRDLKKEKELGFSMLDSLSRACKKPLLKGRKVLVTPHAKPSKEVLKSLVAAAHGQPLERITFRMKNKNFEGTFVISCEQDHSACLPFIKNGLEVFDSELLLNGIITQKLDFERYRLFHEKSV